MASETPSYAEAVVEQNGKIVFLDSKDEAERNYTNAKKN